MKSQSMNGTAIPWLWIAIKKVTWENGLKQNRLQTNLSQCDIFYRNKVKERNRTLYAENRILSGVKQKGEIHRLFP
ncbi:hypothetical protein [Paenibacillus humicus]|uniref:hypothetical protein n=1 Tax=Paenibacillus humicus TaxID=412861 RepID=UPI003D2E9518